MSVVDEITYTYRVQCADYKYIKHTSFISVIIFFYLIYFLRKCYCALEHIETYNLKTKNLFEHVMTPLGCTNKTPSNFKDRVTLVI